MWCVCRCIIERTCSAACGSSADILSSSKPMEMGADGLRNLVRKAWPGTRPCVDQRFFKASSVPPAVRTRPERSITTPVFLTVFVVHWSYNVSDGEGMSNVGREQQAASFRARPGFRTSTRSIGFSTLSCRSSQQSRKDLPPRLAFRVGDVPAHEGVASAARFINVSRPFTSVTSTPSAMHDSVV